MINWKLFALLLLFLVVVLSMSYAVIAYIRHCEKRRKKNIASVSVTEGEFFKRYIPEALYDKYDSLSTNSAKDSCNYVKLPFKVIIVSLSLTLFGVVSASLYWNQDKYLAKIDLTAQELAALTSEHDTIIRNVDMNLPRLEDVIPLVKQRDVILLVGSKLQTRLTAIDTLRPVARQQDIILLESSNAKLKPTDNNTVYPEAKQGEKIFFESSNEGVSQADNDMTRLVAAEQWIHYLTSLGVPYTITDWEEFGLKPVTDPANSLVIVTTASWDFNQLDALLDEGCSILLYGSPQMISDPGNSIEWHGIGFENRRQFSASNLALVADQKLTLGFDAGLILAAKPAFSGHRVVTSKPQAVAVEPHFVHEEQVETRLYSPDLDKGRLVWMDFSPNPQDNPQVNVNHLDAIVASVFRYLSGAVYSDISTWPEGKKFAAFLVMDLDTEVDGMLKVLELIKKHSFPFTWFLLSDFALENRRWIRQLAEAGQVACGGDFNEQFIHYPFTVQLTRIARCKKVLAKISGKEIEGFSPPRQSYDNATVNAMINNKFTYHTTSSSDRGVPVLEVTGHTGKSIISIPVARNQRHALWKGRHFAVDEASTIIQADIDLAKALGSIYSMTIQDDYIFDDIHLNAILYTGKALQGDDCYFSDIKSLSEWWRFRQALRTDKAQNDQLIELYKPVKLTVDQDGKLQRGR